MTLALIQFRDHDGHRGVAAIIDGGRPLWLPGVTTTLALAQAAHAAGEPLAVYLRRRDRAPLDLGSVAVAPIDHADPAHLMLSGTGLTHLGSAEQRDRMHRSIATGTAPQTDSMKMFRMGVGASSRPPDRWGCSRSGSTRATVGTDRAWGAAAVSGLCARCRRGAGSGGRVFRR